MKIKKILVANRGEIALRILRTARQMGISVATIYSEEDKTLPHAFKSDESYSLGAGSLKETYLNQEKIIKIAKECKACAIHPGYGFLSENKSFSKLVEDNGLIFIGPTSSMIELMGDKIGSKKALEKMNIPMIPGYHGEKQDEASLLKEAQKIGFPVLIKASAGGGGKGMKIVHQESDFSEALRAAKSEALNAFSNDQVLLEKYIINPRHIEVQLMSDTKGTHLHFFERDCSIQRRYQKIIEESPAPGLTKELREKICQTAVRISSGINYRGAGTVEFILAPSGEFYFLEMNTRLQVEHPVTEMCTGYDLVKLQILVAQGDRLEIKQDEIVQRGSAIECRLYAEDPDKDFIPSIGKIVKIGNPSLPHTRLDCGYQDNNQMGLSYDPMCAKLIVWDEERDKAITKMIASLNEVVFLGLKTNRSYLQRILGHSEFIAGHVHTHFIPDHQSELKPVEIKDDESALMIAAYLFNHQERSVKSSSKGRTSWSHLSNWRLS